MKRRPTPDDYAAARLNGITEQALYLRFHYGWEYRRAMTQTMRKSSTRAELDLEEFAVYIGDDLEVMGTAKECAEHMGWRNEKVTRFYTSPSIVERQRKRKNAIQVVRLNDVDI